MSPAEIQVKISVAQREADFWKDILQKKSCGFCKHWQHPGCELADGAEPPAEVVKVGCDAWSWDEIPF